MTIYYIAALLIAYRVLIYWIRWQRDARSERQLSLFEKLLRDKSDSDDSVPLDGENMNPSDGNQTASGNPYESPPFR